MRIVVDANVALRLVVTEEPLHLKVKGAVAVLIDAGHGVFYTPQVMREVYHTAMRPEASNGLGRSLEISRGILDLIEASGLSLLDDAPGIYAEWRRLIKTVEIRGRQAHDANHAAALLAHGVTHLLTFDRHDFARYPGISVLNPDEVLAEGFAI